MHLGQFGDEQMGQAHAGQAGCVCVPRARGVRGRGTSSTAAPWGQSWKRTCTALIKEVGRDAFTEINRSVFSLLGNNGLGSWGSGRHQKERIKNFEETG